MYSLSYTGLQVPASTSTSTSTSPALAEQDRERSDLTQSLTGRARNLLEAGVRGVDYTTAQPEPFVKRLVVLAREATLPAGLSQATRQCYVDEMQSIVDRLEHRAPPNGVPGNYVDLRALTDDYLQAAARGGNGDTPLHVQRAATILCLRDLVQRLRLDDPEAMRKLSEPFEAAQVHLRGLDEAITAAAARMTRAVPTPLPRSRITRDAPPPPLPPRTYQTRSHAAADTARPGAEASRSSARTPAAAGRWSASQCVVNVLHADQVIDNTGGFMMVDMSGRGSSSDRRPRPAPRAAASGAVHSPPRSARSEAPSAIRPPTGGIASGGSSAIVTTIRSARNLIIGGEMTVIMGPSTSELRAQARRYFGDLAKLVGVKPQSGLAEDRLDRARALLDKAATYDKLPKAELESYVKELRTMRNTLRRKEEFAAKP